MRDRLTNDHDSFAAALPEMRAHFEGASKASGQYAFVLDSIADDLRRAEQSVVSYGVTDSARAINTARQTLIAIYEEPDFGAIGGEIAAAADIAQRHHKKLKTPGV